MWIQGSSCTRCSRSSQIPTNSSSLLTCLLVNVNVGMGSPSQVRTWRTSKLSLLKSTESGGTPTHSRPVEYTLHTPTTNGLEQQQDTTDVIALLASVTTSGREANFGLTAPIATLIIELVKGNKNFIVALKENMYQVFARRILTVST